MSAGSICVYYLSKVNTALIEVFCRMKDVFIPLKLIKEAEGVCELLVALKWTDSHRSKFMTPEVLNIIPAVVSEVSCSASWQCSDVSSGLFVGKRKNETFSLNT